MAGSFIGGASGTTSATIPAHQVGDLIIARGFRDGNINSPTVPGGVNWTSLDTTNGANNNGASIARKIATSTSETTGTWTNATRLDVGVWRGFSGIGVSAFNDGIGNVNYPALAGMGASSWVAAFGAHRSINTSLETAPTGMTNVYTNVNGTDEGAIHDTEAVVGSWSSQTVTVGGTSSGWRTHVIELLVSASSAAPTWGNLQMMGVG